MWCHVRMSCWPARNIAHLVKWINGHPFCHEKVLTFKEHLKPLWRDRWEPLNSQHPFMHMHLEVSGLSIVVALQNDETLYLSILWMQCVDCNPLRNTDSTNYNNWVLIFVFLLLLYYTNENSIFLLLVLLLLWIFTISTRISMRININVGISIIILLSLFRPQLKRGEIWYWHHPIFHEIVSDRSSRAEN